MFSKSFNMHRLGNRTLEGSKPKINFDLSDFLIAKYIFFVWKLPLFPSS